MRAFGASAEALQQARKKLVAQAKKRGVDVFPENWYALCVFLGMATQWRVIAGLSGSMHLGLDYAALPIVIAEHRATPHRQPLAVLMPQIRTLERAAREILNED